MEAFLSVIDSCKEIDASKAIRRDKLTTLQVNLGDLCNQNCRHCHVEAGPDGKNIMSKKTIDDILMFLSVNKWLILDITGGAPELNPNFEYLIKSARPLVKEIIVRSNLTVFFEHGKGYLPKFYAENKLHLICSLPCYTQDNVDIQRGKNVFKKSIDALKLLNDLGFGERENLQLDLVYNPAGPKLPPPQDILEKDYRIVLNEEYGVGFNRLITITNVPIKRFKDFLRNDEGYGKYLKLLMDNFNSAVLGNIMCRTFLSVGYDGRLYDCDFNLALGLPLEDKKGEMLTIDKINSKDLEGNKIIFGEHCFACTAGSGSGCQGALAEVNKDEVRESVKEYYGKILKNSEDLKTNACCAIETLPLKQRDILRQIEPEIIEKFYGCGSPIPGELNSCKVIDLGCGAGRDSYVVSKLTGQDGFVTGVDMTDEQLFVARKYIDIQMKRFGFKKPNIEFRKGYIENLKEIGIDDGSVDVVISNCVINLSPFKKTVFSEIFRVLKEGGELYFSDVFTDRRLPDHFRYDPVLVGECLGGALYIEDFRRILRDLGCPDYRIVKKRKISINNKDIENKIAMTNFYSVTVRAFKLKNLEDKCEDYGQIVTYLGTIENNPSRFMLDSQHIFIKGKPMLVCGNTASMIQETRYVKHFKIEGDRDIHYGLFNCSPAVNRVDKEAGGSCC